MPSEEGVVLDVAASVTQVFPELLGLEPGEELGRKRLVVFPDLWNAVLLSEQVPLLNEVDPGCGVLGLLLGGLRGQFLPTARALGHGFHALVRIG